MISATQSTGSLAQSLFDRIDTDKSRAIKLDELKAALGQKDASAGSAVDKLFATFDSNGDGALSTDEFSAKFNTIHPDMLNALLQLQGGSDATGTDAVFSQIDADGDGTLSKGEMDRYLAKALTTLSDLLTKTDQANSAGSVDITG